MKRELVVTAYRKEDIILDGNRFLLANGHLGYRGTLEEYGKEQLVSLTIAGVYDQYQDQWRENLSLPNPFYFKAHYEGIKKQGICPIHRKTFLKGYVE